MIRLLIVDDHPIVRDGLAMVLGDEPDMEVIGTAENLQQARKAVAAHRPDVLLLDLELPDGNAGDTIPSLVLSHPGVAILIFTAYDTDDRILTAVRAGARGYLLKGAPADEIKRAIRALHSGGSYLASRAAATVLHAASTQGRSRPDTELSERERDVLKEVVAGASNKQIAQALGITERTVKFHLTAILRKLDAESRTEAATIAIRRKLV